MKAIKIASGNSLDQALEAQIKQKDKQLKELAIKNAIHHSNENRPAPTKDMLEHYTGELRSGYEMAHSEIYHIVQPHGIFADAKIEDDFLNEKQRLLNIEAQAKLGEIKNLKYANQNSGGGVLKRALLCFIFTFIINIGEIIFNSKSFQVTGESYLFSLMLSAIVSFAVFMASHMIPFLYKHFTKPLWRKLLIWGSLALVCVVFVVLAIWRSTYLANHEVAISPLFFVLFNLFFFIVSTGVSFLFLPTIEEFKAHLEQKKVLALIAKLEREVGDINEELEKIHQAKQENTKACIWVTSHYNSLMDRLRKMYWETIEIYKATNRTYRKDGIIPACFSDVLPNPAIENIIFPPSKF